MIAILGGLATATLWATTLLSSARAARLIGSWATLGWVMLIGLAVVVPAIVLTAPTVAFTDSQVAHLAVAGVANSAGLLFVYTALQRGKVAVVGPIVSTEGAIGAVLAILAGDPIGATTGVLLALIALGVVLAATEPEPTAGEPPRTGALATAAIALTGAILFGINLYATSRVAGEVPLAWTVLPARLAGVIGVSLPLILAGRLRLVRAAVPFVIVVGVAEVAGVATFAIGAAQNAAVASVISSQFAAIAAVAAFILFRERLSRIQLAGVVTIAVGVALLAAAQAGAGG